MPQHQYLNHIDQVVNSAIFFQQDVSIVALVLLQSTLRYWTVIRMQYEEHQPSISSALESYELEPVHHASSVCASHTWVSACQTYLQNSLAHFLIQMCQRHNTVEGNASGLLLFEVDVGRVSVEADADRLQLPCQDVSVKVGFGCIQHHEQ